MVIRNGKVTISTEEYEHLCRMEGLAHKQRFMLKQRERELERYKARTSRFVDKTLKLLLDHYPMEVVMEIYKEKNETDN